MTSAYRIVEIYVPYLQLCNDYSIKVFLFTAVRLLKNVLSSIKLYEYGFVNVLCEIKAIVVRHVPVPAGSQQWFVTRQLTPDVNPLYPTAPTTLSLCLILTHSKYAPIPTSDTDSSYFWLYHMAGGYVYLSISASQLCLLCWTILWAVCNLPMSMPMIRISIIHLMQKFLRSFSLKSVITAHLTCQIGSSHIYI